MSDIRLVIVDSGTFLCVSLHHSPSLSGPSPFLVFSQSCVSSHENRQGLRGEDLGGLRGGGWTGRGGRGWNGGLGGGMAPKKLTRQLGLGRPLWQRSYWEESHKTLGPYLKFMMCAFWSAIYYGKSCSLNSQPSVFICCFKTSFHWGQVASSSSTCFVGEVVPLKLIIILAF